MAEGPVEAKCRSCKIARGEPVEGERIPIVELLGGWTLNHYGGPEGYLGWLALQPREHRLSLQHLSFEEQTHLGSNIVTVDRLLGEYWLTAYRERIERVYVAYFYESAATHPYHLHFHLIPRFAGIEARLRAWEAPRATLSATFPEQYRRGTPQFEERVAALMEFLELHTQRTPNPVQPTGSAGG